MVTWLGATVLSDLKHQQFCTNTQSNLCIELVFRRTLVCFRKVDYFTTSNITERGKESFSLQTLTWSTKWLCTLKVTHWVGGQATTEAQVTGCSLQVCHYTFHTNCMKILWQSSNSLMKVLPFWTKINRSHCNMLQNHNRGFLECPKDKLNMSIYILKYLKDDWIA